MSPKTTPTAARIAAMCGVSVMTVSRALRPNSPVAPQTRQRILEAAESLGYRPALNMGRPRRTETLDRQSVDVILAMATKPLFYSALLVSIEQELTRRWHDCVIRTCGTDYAQFLTLCEVLRSRDSMGTLVLGYMPVEQLQALLDVAPDAILVDHTGDSRLTSPYRSIGFDNAEAARLAVRHLLAAGRRRIALVRGPADHYFTRDVEQGYRECLREARVKVREELILDTDFTAAGGARVVAQALADKREFDAVFTNDEMACGILRTLHEHKLRVPEDVAVVGCDGLPIGEHLVPRLTTVVLPYEELGQMAVEQLLDKRGKPGAASRVRLVPRLEVRESSGVTVDTHRR
ncbi:MAG: hypothetical protein A3K19_13960 [Lentisphaerae bacterium RIFOXYB12_FULL_65_16]|nr:MAG: hypothetical protein A3K19_13960 [Lentisphaerae bacterium RIFOXYB12_FULL_65_16]